MIIRPYGGKNAQHLNHISFIGFLVMYFV